jgi:hypothetical protein
VCYFGFPPFVFSLDLSFTLSSGAVSIWVLARRGAVGSQTQFSQRWIWVLEVFFVSASALYFPDRFLVGVRLAC